MAGTIFGRPVGKWQLGTDVGGQEAALSGKWIGLSIPERRYLSTTGVAEGVVIGLVLAWIFWKRK